MAPVPGMDEGAIIHGYPHGYRAGPKQLNTVESSRKGHKGAQRLPVNFPPIEAGDTDPRFKALTCRCHFHPLCGSLRTMRLSVFRTNHSRVRSTTKNTKNTKRIHQSLGKTNWQLTLCPSCSLWLSVRGVSESSMFHVPRGTPTVFQILGYRPPRAPSLRSGGNDW